MRVLRHLSYGGAMTTKPTGGYGLATSYAPGPPLCFSCRYPRQFPSIVYDPEVAEKEDVFAMQGCPCASHAPPAHAALRFRLRPGTDGETAHVAAHVSIRQPIPLTVTRRGASGPSAALMRLICTSMVREASWRPHTAWMASARSTTSPPASMRRRRRVNPFPVRWISCFEIKAWWRFG